MKIFKIRNETITDLIDVETGEVVDSFSANIHWDKPDEQTNLSKENNHNDEPSPCD